MEDLRKLAANVFGRAALEERFGTPRLSAVDAVLQAKTASADPELLKVAAAFDTGDDLNMYEDIGGEYKVAVSNTWLRDSLRRAVQGSEPGRASSERIGGFVSKMKDVADSSRSSTAGKAFEASRQAEKFHTNRTLGIAPEERRLGIPSRKPGITATRKDA